jgi:mRNA interferase MazF
VAAITSKVSTPPYPNEALIHPSGSGLHVTSTVRLDQLLHTVDRQRLLKRLGAVDGATLRQVDQAIKASLGLVSM